jgi:prevent-host-death family protein
MHAFTIRDLRDRTADLVRDAEAGKLSIVTKHGQPVFVAVPFSEELLNHGVPTALAVHLFDEEQITAAQGARLAGLSLSSFIDLLGSLHIPVTRLAAGELAREVAAFE